MIFYNIIYRDPTIATMSKHLVTRVMRCKSFKQPLMLSDDHCHLVILLTKKGHLSGICKDRLFKMFEQMNYSLVYVWKTRLIYSNVQYCKMCEKFSPSQRTQRYRSHSHSRLTSEKIKPSQLLKHQSQCLTAISILHET